MRRHSKVTFNFQCTSHGRGCPVPADGIEPPCAASETAVLPLNYAGVLQTQILEIHSLIFVVLEPESSLSCQDPSLVKTPNDESSDLSLAHSKCFQPEPPGKTINRFRIRLIYLSFLHLTSISGSSQDRTGNHQVKSLQHYQLCYGPNVKDSTYAFCVSSSAR